jgi:hypothetical protein
MVVPPFIFTSSTEQGCRSTECLPEAICHIGVYIVSSKQIFKDTLIMLYGVAFMQHNPSTGNTAVANLRLAVGHIANHFSPAKISTSVAANNMVRSKHALGFP